VVDEVLHQLRATTTHHRVIVDVPETLPPVSLDFVQISHALLNLVENAVKYAPRGSAIVVAARVGAGAVRVSVTDDGPGIPPRALPYVLDPFYRVAGTAARAAAQTSGTGLGLAVVRGLVEAHGGTVGVQSPPPGHPHGTAVTFDLPLHPLDTALPTATTTPMMTSPLTAAAWAVPAVQPDHGG
jgi:two-component system sensor histidine kinase KdpD